MRKTATVKVPLPAIDPQEQHSGGRVSVISPDGTVGTIAADEFTQAMNDIFANVDKLDTFQNAIIGCDILITTVWFLQTRGRWRGEQPGSAERRLRRYFKPFTDGCRTFWNFGKTTT